MESWNRDVAKQIYAPLAGDLPLRVLELEPGASGDPLRCRLIATNIDQIKGRYEATSYTWGAPVDPETIECDGLPLKIQKNAFAMLNDFRLPDKVRTIWIDAICINQGDLDERAAQVTFMHFIYALAQSVTIWLGQPDQSSSIAMKFAATLHAPKYIREYETTIGLHGGNPAQAAIDKTNLLSPGASRSGLSVSADETAALIEFLSRPWFSRIWVVQEASACPVTRVICGADSVPWDQIFALGWIMLAEVPLDVPDHVDRSVMSALQRKTSCIKSMQYTRTYRFPKDPYASVTKSPGYRGLLETAHWHEATDPRDKIYTMVSLCMIKEDLTSTNKFSVRGFQTGDIRYPAWLPPVDYTVPWEVLYVDVAQRLFLKGLVVMLFRSGRARHPRGWHLPSWAMDFRGPNDNVELPYHRQWVAGGPTYLNPIARYEAVAKMLPKGYRRVYDKTLMSPEFKTYKGRSKECLSNSINFQILARDEVTWTGHVSYDHRACDVEDYPLSAEILACVDMEMQQVRTQESSSGVSTYITGESLLDAYKLTLVAGLNHTHDHAGAEYVQANWDDYISHIEEINKSSSQVTQQMPFYKQAISISGAWHDARFAITKHGYFCLLPRMAQVGDTIAVIKGHKMPSVLRAYTPPKPSNTPAAEEYFELIGDSYVHGLMFNQAGCISVEFGYKPKMTDKQRLKVEEKVFKSDDKVWEALGFGDYSRILPTIGPGWVNIV